MGEEVGNRGFSRTVPMGQGVGWGGEVPEFTQVGGPPGGVGARQGFIGYRDVFEKGRATGKPA